MEQQCCLGLTTSGRHYCWCVPSYVTPPLDSIFSHFILAYKQNIKPTCQDDENILPVAVPSLLPASAGLEAQWKSNFLFKPRRSDLRDFSFKKQSKHMMISPPSPTIGGWQRPLSRHGEESNLWEAAAIREAIGEATRQGERRPETNSQINLQPQPLLVASSNSVSWAAEPATLIPEEYFSLSWAGDPFYSVGKKKGW